MKGASNTVTTRDDAGADEAPVNDRCAAALLVNELDEYRLALERWEARVRLVEKRDELARRALSGLLDDKLDILLKETPS